MGRTMVEFLRRSCYGVATIHLAMMILFLQHQTVLSVSDTTQVDKDNHFITLGSENFTHQVLESVDSWIAVFHKDPIEDSWKELSVSLRGLVWLGTIDVNKQTELATKLNVDQSKSSSARVYPHGGINVKRSHWQTVKDWHEAERFAVKSIPDSIPVITANKLDDFIKESYHSDPARFPTLLITDTRETTPLFRAIQQRFKRYFNLGILVNPTQDNIQTIGFKDNSSPSIPSLVVIVKQTVKEPPQKKTQNRPKTKSTKSAKHSASTKPSNPPKFTLQALEYSKERFGEFSYGNIMQFFFSINHQFRHTLPSSPKSGTKIVYMMSDIMDIEQERYDELFDRKMVFDSKKSNAEGNGTKPKYEGGENDSGGGCPFGFDKKINQAKDASSVDKNKMKVTNDKQDQPNMERVEL